MAQRKQTTGARTEQRSWLKVVQTLLQLGVLVGGGLGSVQAVASATVTPLQDTQTQGSPSLEREAVRLALADAPNKSGGPGNSPAKYPTPAGLARVTHSLAEPSAQSFGFILPLRAKRRLRAFRARAPPRPS
jgi:hypothetical protein